MNFRNWSDVGNFPGVWEFTSSHAFVEEFGQPSACLVAAMLRVFGYPPVSHYALVGLAIGRSLDASLLVVLSHVNKLAVLCCVHNKWLEVCGQLGCFSCVSKINLLD